MNGKQQYSDEHLNAFIDEQLDNTEKAELLDVLRHDTELSQRVCKLQKLHNLVQLSYQSIEVPKRHQANDDAYQPSKVKWIAAASLFLAVGMLSGWLSNQALNSNKLYNIAEIIQNNSPANQKKWRLMLHVSTANPNRLKIVLDEAEALLEEYAAASKTLELEILTNSEGLALVTNNHKQYNHRLQNLQVKYKNLVVMACGQTLKRLQRAHGKPVDLLPQTNVVSSAINQIVKRQKEGWSYIRI
ncbi:DsrE family protein [Beggiatoa alba]|nr:DsrE family protein [Beggiatoa alba]